MDMLSARGTVAHSPCRADPGRRWRWAWWRSVDRHQPRPVSPYSEERSGIDVAITLPEAEVEVIGRRSDHIAHGHRGSDADPCTRQTPVRRGAAVHLGRHDVPYPGDDTAERDDSIRGSNDRRSRRWLVLQSAIAPAERALRSTKRIDDRRLDGRLVAAWGQQQQGDDRTDHDAAADFDAGLAGASR